MLRLGRLFTFGILISILLSCAEEINYQALLEEAAKEINAECPIMIDNETRLDSVTTAENLTFVYYYTLIYMDKLNVNVDELKGYLEPNVLDNAQYNDAMEDFRQNRVTMIYRYVDMEGSFLFEIDVRPEDYLEEEEEKEEPSEAA